MATLPSRALRRTLAERNWQIRRLPRPLVRHPERELRATFEHVVARHMLARDDGPFFFVQIGAFDGETADPIRPFVDRFGWHGLLVEPQERYFRALERSYAGQEGLRLRRVAIAEPRGTRTMYKLSEHPGLPEWAPRLATFDLQTLRSHRDEIPGIDSLVITEEVDCLPLAELLAEESIDRIDLLCVDAEGYDTVILRMMDFTAMRPAIVRFEHDHLSGSEHRAAIQMLLDAGYDIALERFDTVAELVPGKDAPHG